MNRAFPLAIGITTGNTSGRLTASSGRIILPENFIPVLNAILGRILGRVLARQVYELKVLTHDRYRERQAASRSVSIKSLMSDALGLINQNRPTSSWNSSLTV